MYLCTTCIRLTLSFPFPISATFPDMLEIVLLADGSKTVRDLFNQVLIERGKMEPYSIYIDGARAPLELDMTSAVLDGHTVSVKYLPSSSELQL